MGGGSEALQFAFGGALLKGASKVGGKVLQLGGRLERGVGVTGEGTKLLESRFPKLAKKFSKHSKEWSKWGSMSQEAFYKRAVNLADSPVGGHVKGFTSKNGWSFRFNTKTGELLTIHPSGYIETFFRPEQGLDYYLKQVQLYGK